MSIYKEKEVVNILDDLSPEEPSSSEPPVGMCNFNQNGTRRFRFGVGMLFLSIFMLLLNSDIPPANEWLLGLMSGVLLIVGILSINTSNKELESPESGNAS